MYLFDVAPRGRTRLLRATASDVHGDGPDPATWWYRLTIQGPHTKRTVTAPAASVVHVRYATESHSPARGIAPLQYAALTGTLTANLERSLGYEAAGAVANLITLPEGFNAQPPTEDGEAPSPPDTSTNRTSRFNAQPPTEDDEAPAVERPGDALAEAIRTAKGRTLLPETTASSYGDPGARPPRRDWEPARLGANPPMAMVQLRQHVESTVLACFGVPARLGPMGVNDGTAQREALRRFLDPDGATLADLIAEELTCVLERPVVSTIGQSAGVADVAGRARAVKALIEAGIDKADAMRRVGWNGE